MSCVAPFVQRYATTAQILEETTHPDFLHSHYYQFCKVVAVWQDFLSEYVDKKFTCTYATNGQLDMNESIMAAKIVKFTTVIKLCNLQQLKYRRLLRRVRFSGRRVPLSDKPTANRAAVM